ncbi:cytochrome P450 4A10 [Cucurbitaria berberidis CBS 394.84]|uniref:Cytochrome P450 4A10 n=1 Tax=Cucurbitaria berberidis CBS 394.84 TaxID=1168544 RepID=A0A9P4GCQ8_9PLEO|nr:cytochrome P450 4A10 [Cucurbitaria berberidis CBS 394.84]KAF1843493.1 cytochrome P450 4A10 [Cucurbitaria berberidis CBS 394.84]
MLSRMAIHGVILDEIRAHPLVSLFLTPLTLLLIRSLYRVYFHPLSHIAGPLLPKITSLWLHYHAYVGDEASVIHLLHQQYGPYVRVSPDEVDINDADVIPPIYVSKGGFPKAPCYANFDIDGHSTIFSSTNAEYRNSRAKAVVPMFSTKSLRENELAIWGCVDRMVERLIEESQSKRVVNVLNLTRSLAIDAVSTHLFRENYDGVSERGPVLSVSAFVDAFVAVGRFFYLPNTVFVWVDWAVAKWQADRETDDSMTLVDRFVGTLVANTAAKSTTFPGRLLAAGLSDSETKAQCKDLVFAGTDSTGMNLATIIRNLALYPGKYERLKKQVNANAALGGNALDVQALPYLNAVVKEGLRISMANPTRLPHVVPLSGWTFKDTYFPAGSIVGCSGYELHLNPAVFPEPQSFRPERWLKTTDEMSKYWFAFGAGSRACIARNLATMELQFATERLARSNVLDGARPVQGEVEIFEWFNSKVKGEKIELIWDGKVSL